MERKLPIGAEPQPNGGVHFRVWAPESKNVRIEFQGGPKGTALFNLKAEAGGYFAGLAAEARPGTLYKIQLDSGAFPDPASRFQPEGPHGPSEVVDPGSFKWTDQPWNGIRTEQLVLYELHLGTFTRAGTWQSAAEELPELKRIGITAVEIMPIADFSGRFGWGYDGVDLFAPSRLYGR